MTAVYDAWCSLKEVHAPLIARVAARNEITTERLLQSSLLCVSLHDVGKLTRNFADMMRAKNEAEYKEAVRRNYRHEVAPLWLITQAAQAMNKRQGIFPGDGLLETLAVAGHHKYLAPEYLIDERKFVGKALAWEHGVLQDISAAFGLARRMFQEQGWRFPKFNVSQEELESLLTQANGAQSSPPFDHLVDTKNSLSKTKADFRDLFVLLKGLLMTADWMASGAKGEVEALDARHGVIHRIQPGLVEEYLRHRHDQRDQARPDLRLKPFQGYTKFQADCGAAVGHVVAIAPTGSGKTEASWLWALGQVERGHARKILVLLPTMVTSNSIHKRLEAFFKPKGHRVGLVHSTADLIHSSSKDDDRVEDESDRADVRSDLSETHYFLPVTVGTVDQLLVPLFHAGRWALKTLAAASSAVIIDEVHAYDPHTLGLITLMIRQFAPLGTRFMVMSATMPKPLLSAIEAALKSDASDAPGVTLIQDPELLESTRNTWETRDIPLTQWLLPAKQSDRPVPSPEFLELWGSRNERGQPLKILIVVNTVKLCQDLAKSLREFGFELVCYHSKFIFDHRREKERRIDDNPPRLLIATQVVEVSLDIDYDILLTECAPIDALVQRAGRVNRSRRKVPGRVVIFRHEKESETVYAYPRGVLEATWECCRAIDGPPTEKTLINLVERVYDGDDPMASDAYSSIQNATRCIQGRLYGVLDSPRPHEEDAILKTRKDDYPQISVIPDCFSDQVNHCLPKQRRRYELKIPVWYARKHKVRTDDIPLCPMDYDPEFGAELLASPEHPEPNQLFC